MGDETSMARAKGVLELNIINILNAKVDALTKMVSKFQINSLESANAILSLVEDLIHTLNVM